ncbi:MAG: hypothetical protein RL213_521 [Bacteroidota bacterium]|jgi:gliding motility-associated-like protein
MKRHLLLLLLFAAFSAPAQTNTFYRRYNIPGMQGGLSIVETPDGGFVGIGQHEGNGSAGDCDIYAYKVDACGNLQWMKLMGTGRQEGGKSIFRRANGHLLLVGLYDATGFLMELDMNGNLLWERRYNGLSWTIAVTEDQTGNLIVTGTTSSNAQYVVMKCDPVGNVIWSKLYDGLGYLATSVLRLPQNRFLVSAAFNVPNGDFSLNCIDGNGTVLWSKSYGGFGFSDVDHNPWGSKSILDPSGSYVYVVSQTAVNGSDNILLSKINLTSHSDVWTKVIGDNNSEQPRDIVLTDQGVAILGNTSSFNVPANPAAGIFADMGERDVLLINLDAQGNKLWARTYGAEERDKGIGLRHNDDGTFLISAYTSSPYFGNTDISMDPLFIRTDSLGMVACQVYSPPITVQAYNLTSSNSGTASAYPVSAFAAASIVADYSPSDNYQCLSCITEPLFVPSDTVVCVNDTVHFFNTTVIGLTCFQRWSVDGSLFDGSLDTITYVFDQPGTYPILLYSNCGASTDTFRTTIRVTPYPATDFSTSDGCLRDTTQFTNNTLISSGVVAAFNWSLGDNTYSSDFSPSHIYRSPGSYTVLLSATSEDGCMYTDYDTVTIHPLPLVSFYMESVCDRDSSEVFNNTTSVTPVSNYEWDFGDGTTSLQESPRHLFPGPGHYYVGLTATDVNGCEERFYNELDVFPLPRPEFIFSPPSCDIYSFAEFENRSSNYIYAQWSFGDGDTSSQQFASHHYASSGSYEVVLHLESDKGCVDSVIKKMDVNSSFAVWIPNAFTPNGDGVNERFIPLTLGVKALQMDIFNRWGKIVFHTEDLDQGWDGCISDVFVQEDVYEYLISVTDQCDDKHTYLGHVSVIK